MIPRPPENKLPHPAIRPYPIQYATPWKLKNKAPVFIRPIRPEDEPLMVKFHETLSEESVYNRYFSALKLSQRVAHERLTRICFNDYDREIALVAELKVAERRGEKNPRRRPLEQTARQPNDAEFAVLVSDEWQRQGLGTELLRRLIEIGRVEKLAQFQRRDPGRKPRHAAHLPQGWFQGRPRPGQQFLQRQLRLLSRAQIQTRFRRHKPAELFLPYVTDFSTN